MSNAIKNIKASAFQVIGRLLERSLGLVSTLILARVLMPEDFGLVAIVTLVIMFVESIAETGALDYIVQKKEIDDDDVNTAWTLNICLKFVVFFAILMSTPFIASYYDDDRLLLALPVLSLVVLAGALINPYLLVLQRERSYGVIFRIGIIKKFISAGVTIAGAFVFKNYWALIIGHLTSVCISLTLSYAFFSYRPKVTLLRVRKQLSFSQWTLLRSVFGYCRSQLDTILVSDRFGMGALGGYHVSKYISTMPASEVVSPAMSPLLASFSNVQTSQDELKYQVEFSLLILLAFTMPIASFIYINAYEIATILLGEKWLEFVPVFGLLAISVVTIPLINLATAILYTKKAVKKVLVFDVGSFLALACALFFLPLVTVEEFAQAKVALDVLMASGFIVYALMYAKINVSPRVILLLFFTLVFCCFSAYEISSLITKDVNPLVSLLIEGPVYLLALLFFWVLTFAALLKKTKVGIQILGFEQRFLGRIRILRLFS